MNDTISITIPKYRAHLILEALDSAVREGGMRAAVNLMPIAEEIARQINPEGELTVIVGG
jgi:hypothetical protein